MQLGKMQEANSSSRTLTREVLPEGEDLSWPRRKGAGKDLCRVVSHLVLTGMADGGGLNFLLGWHLPQAQALPG